MSCVTSETSTCRPRLRGRSSWSSALGRGWSRKQWKSPLAETGSMKTAKAAHAVEPIYRWAPSAGLCAVEQALTRSLARSLLSGSVYETGGEVFYLPTSCRYLETIESKLCVVDTIDDQYFLTWILWSDLKRRTSSGLALTVWRVRAYTEASFAGCQLKHS